MAWAPIPIVGRKRSENVSKTEKKNGQGVQLANFVNENGELTFKAGNRKRKKNGDGNGKKT